MGKEVFIKLVGDKSYRDKGCVDKEIQKFRRSGVRSSWTRSRRQGVVDKETRSSSTKSLGCKARCLEIKYFRSPGDQKARSSGVEDKEY